MLNRSCVLCAVIAVGLTSGPAGAADKLTSKVNSTPKVAATTVSCKSSSCPPAAAPECKVYKPCVTYKYRLCECDPTAHQVLRVKDPCDCCCCSIAEIPVCLPTCCKDPCVSSKCGIGGRGIVWYEYDCGVCVKIVFRKCGDVVVVVAG